ncbi:zona pellucida sperm-binding protein 4-like isoform X2 [Hippocampus comes]|uniref:zona pellucida sperm-binding protein 4-like isoform X2 n=1 Tax=Hippocampus comes TaxID=109280 RepID=UPI00094EB149|nr:PREDICTED: zona pellucida sperm-binding protein 4-like isoform X2 [Hippocampus comes]
MAHLWLLMALSWGVLVSGWEQDHVSSLSETLKPETGTWEDDDGSGSEYNEGAFTDFEEVETLEPDPGKRDGATPVATQEETIEPSLRIWTSTTEPSHSGFRVTCDDEGFRIILPASQFRDVKVLSAEHPQPADHAGCGLNASRLENILTVPFTGCHVENTDSYSLQLLYEDELGETRVTTVMCHTGRESTPGPIPRSGIPPGTPASRCRTPPPPHTPPRAQQCAVAPEERLPCGHSGILPFNCEAMGCCVNPTRDKCFYPMDECTVDLHFVFIIRSTYASLPVDPTQLVIPGTDCKPVVVNADFAIFKFKVSECGTRTYDIGMTRFYLAEVQTLVRALNLKYGIITRTDPLRFLVECRYSLAAHDQQPFASAGYMVKIPSRSLPTAIPSDGLYGVQLRIATDETFSSFLPSFPTLRYILGKPVYLELRLLSPKPDATILVKYCLAFPRSAKNALVLVYEGCANPHDPNVAILQISNLPQNRHQRHFEVKVFQFMDVKTKRYLNEQINFMCSSEVCRSDEKTCEERCFDGKVP